MSWGQVIGGLATLILAGLAIAVVISILTYEEILSWFQPRTNLLEKDRNIVGYTIMKHFNNGNYETVQGVFDTSSQQVLESRTIESKKVDAEVAEMHRETGYVIYTLN
jgi:hypothetical protein